MKGLAKQAPGKRARKGNGPVSGKVDYLDTAASLFMKLMLLVALFCPASTTMAGNRHPQYYQEFLLVNAAGVLFLFFYILKQNECFVNIKLIHFHFSNIFSDYSYFSFLWINNNWLKFIRITLRFKHNKSTFFKSFKFF